jgi:hypothetical protein
MTPLRTLGTRALLSAALSALPACAGGSGTLASERQPPALVPAPSAPAAPSSSAVVAPPPSATAPLATASIDGNGAPCGGTCAEGRRLVTLASGQSFAHSVAVDEGFIYWTNHGTPGGVLKCALTGCGDKPTTLVESATGAPQAIAVAGGQVYFTTYAGAAILRCASTGCDGKPTTLASGQPIARHLALDATHLYWTRGESADNDTGDGSVMKCALGGCAGKPSALATKLFNPHGIAVGAGFVHWTSLGDGAVSRCPLDGCRGTPAKQASEQAFPQQIVADAANLYWTNDGGSNGQGSVMSCAITDCAGSLHTLAKGLDHPDAIAVDEAHVYFTASHGKLMKCPLAGCGEKPPTLLVGQGASSGGSIAVDATSVYFASRTRVMKLSPK